MIDLTIVTTVHNYGRYLGDWVGSILGQTVRPARVVLLEHGSTDHSGRLAADAAARLEAAGIPGSLLQSPERLDFGRARNLAVEQARTEWVMHFDADDLLMPHALADVAPLLEQADVVAMGYRRIPMGANPALPGMKLARDRVYPDTQGLTSRSCISPASGVSPFRRALWAQRPYRTDMIGGWDTALWMDFSHLEARFVATKRAGFWYRQHRDSLFNTRNASGWPKARTAAQIQARRDGATGVSVVVPRGGEDGLARGQAWDWIRARYQARHPSWQIVEGQGDPNDWRKGVAIADGVARATGRILVIADADCLVPAAALEEAVARVDRGDAPWVVPHTMVHRLDAQATAAWLAGDPAAETLPATPARDRLAREPYQGYAGGGALVVNRAIYEATGGVPAAFVGWGGEDEALACLLDALVGKHHRLPHDLIHLWHPPQPTQVAGPNLRENRDRVLQVRQAAAAGDQERLWALVRTLGTPHLRGQGTGTNERYPQLARATGRRTNGITRERTVHDDFATRRLARAHQRKTEGGTPMAGALDYTRQAKRERAEQDARNKAAAAEADARRTEATRVANLHPDQQRRIGHQQRRKAQAAGSPENKMLDGRGGTENKSRLLTDAQRRRPNLPPAPDIVFASPQAKQAAEDGGLVPADFQDAESGPQGFTATVVRQIVTAKEKKAAEAPAT